MGLARIWPRWRRTTRRWASRPRRARARRRATATSSEHAAKEQLHEGGSSRSRESLPASRKQIVDRQRVSTLSLKDLRVSTPEIGVFSAPTFWCSLALRISLEVAELPGRLASLSPCHRACREKK